MFGSIRIARQRVEGQSVQFVRQRTFPSIPTRLASSLLGRSDQTIERRIQEDSSGLARSESIEFVSRSAMKSFLFFSLRIDKESSKAFVVKTTVPREKLLARETFVAVLIELPEKILRLSISRVNALAIVVGETRQIVDRLNQRLQFVFL